MNFRKSCFSRRTKKEKLINNLENHKVNFKYSTKNLFICAGAGHSPSLISKLGYRHNKLGKFQIHPTARISLIPKIKYDFTEIVEPFQITEFFPYLMVGSSANREYLSRINYPYRNESNIDFAKCMNLYSMAPSERRGEIRLRRPFKGVRSYFLSNEARGRIKKGLEIIIDIARRSKAFKCAYSPAGIIDIENLDNNFTHRFINQTINSTLCSVHIFSSAVAGKHRKLCPLNEDECSQYEKRICFGFKCYSFMSYCKSTSNNMCFCINVSKEVYGEPLV